MGMSAGRRVSNSENASSPPADAPTPTTGKPLGLPRGGSGVGSTRFEPSDGGEALGIAAGRPPRRLACLAVFFLATKSLLAAWLSHTTEPPRCHDPIV